MNYSINVPKIMLCVLAMGSLALSQQPPVRTIQSDQPDPPGTCINNRFGSDCDLAQTGLLGHVKSVEDWLMRQGRKESFGHWIRNFSTDGHLTELGGREASGEIKISQWYSYDDKGRRVQVKVVDPNPKNNNIETRTYDAAGRMTGYESQRGSGTPYRTEWTYNAVGLLATSDNLPDSHTEYRYDDRNRLIAVTTTCATHPTSYYCGAQKVQYEYPSSDRKRTLDFTTCRKSDDASDTPSMITDEIFDSSGHLRSSTLTTTDQFANWPTACQSIYPGRHVYGYDSAGNRNVALFYDPSGKLEWSEAITFDSHGKPLVEATTTSSKSKQPRSVTRWTREYDSHGNVTLETYDGGVHETLHRIVTYYDN